MKTLYSYDAVPNELQNGVMAIGNYDGVHRGHQIILDKVKNISQDNAKPAGLICFSPHPRAHFFPDQPHFYLSTEQRKLKLLQHFGLDLALVLAFNQELANLSAEDFVSRILVDGLHISHIVIGYNFYYGKKRQGTPESLVKFGEKYGFGVTIIPEQKDLTASYSSTRIRDLLRNGQVREAADLLGYWWRVEGTVTSGAQIGTSMGYPTANISLSEGQDLRKGIYAVNAFIDGKRYPAAAYLGKRPTFDNGKTLLEVFIMNYEGNLYNRNLEVEFIDFIRDDQKFVDMESLKLQMDDDVDQIREVLSDFEKYSGNILSI
ncbi:MAG: bifunctional riboflavin kinase/FAD synthetase [Methyloligellaceae bacterium]